MVVDIRGFQMMPDMSGLNNNIGALINRQISDKLVGKAMGGDDTAMVNLAARDPQQHQALGKIFNQRQEQERFDQDQALQEQQRQIAVLGPLAKGYVNASDKKSYLAAAARKLREAGFDEYAANVENDLNTYDQNPAAIDEDYNAAVAMFGQASGSDSNSRSSTPLFGGRLRQIERRDGSMETLDAAGNPIAPEDVPAAWEAAQKAHLEYLEGESGARQQGGDTVRLKMKPQIESETRLAAAQADYDSRQLKAQTEAETAFAKAAAQDQADKIARLETALPSKEAMLASNISKIQNTMENTTAAIGLTNWGTTGWAGMVFRNLPTDAGELNTLITSIQANLGLDELNAMKAMSTSGGSGMGALAVAELEALQSVVNNLSQVKNKPEALKRSLTKINEHYMNYKDRMEDILAREKALLGRWKEEAAQNFGARQFRSQGPIDQLPTEEQARQPGSFTTKSGITFTVE